MEKLSIQNIEPLLECLPEEELKVKFTNLVNGHSAKYEDRKR